MTLYVFDTDHLSLYGRNHPVLIDRLQQQSIILTTTVINIEEQVRGRLAQISEAKDGDALANAYRWLSETVKLLSEFEVLQFTAQSQSIYRDLKSQRIRVGTQDLRIASIVLANKGILLSRNARDFERIPNLLVENWTMEA
ncbi:type II toxin-antitoxin system VapC family toxin [Chamaesiphon sp. OTE_8_metabat_110]|uniref:type II toxin-antitoxin system VapC family toxin n=1 Tax=Chamaesiphon sp. OTE_8_metabat_110 TaxID=2964696 RepID=UPI00286D02C0|nr:type II toxin-antitoxin system VapC family toxin [Chamaesiphon sp. OTE_8_metabat_110]